MVPNNNLHVRLSHTSLSLQLNLPEDALPRCRFVYGDWSDVAAVVAPLKFDVLLTAETIYNTDYYPKLCGLILATLVPGGVCLLAAKRFYFGVGGGTRVFEQIAATYGLDVTVLEVLEDKVSNIRELCAVRHAVKGGT